MLLLFLSLFFHCDSLNSVTFEKADSNRGLRTEHKATRNHNFMDCSITNIMWNSTPGIDHSNRITPQDSFLPTPIGHETCTQSTTGPTPKGTSLTERFPQANRRNLKITQRKISNRQLKNIAFRHHPRHQLNHLITVLEISKRRNPGSEAKASSYDSVRWSRQPALHRIKRSQKLSTSTKKRLFPNLLLSDGTAIKDEDTNSEDDDELEKTIPQKDAGEGMFRIRKVPDMTKKLWYSDRVEFQMDRMELQTDRMKLQTDSNEFQTDRKELQTERIDMQTDRKELQTERIDMPTDRMELQTGRMELQTDRMELQTDRTKLQTGRTELQTGRMELQTDRMELKTDRSKLQTDRTELQTDSNELQTDRKELQTERIDMQTDRMELQTGRMELQTDRMELQTDRTKFQTGRTELQTGRMELQTDRMELKTDRTKLQTDRTELQTDRKELQTDRIELQTDKMELQKDRTELQMDRTEMSTATAARQFFRQITFAHPYFEMIETLQEGYMMVFLIELTRLIATKESKAVRDVIKHTDQIIRGFYLSRQLRWFGKPLIDVTRKLTRLLKESKIDVIQSYADTLHHQLSERHEELSGEVNTMLEYADMLYNDDEGRLLFDALKEFAAYPNIRLTGYWLCNSLINNFLRPFRRLKDTQQCQELIDSVNSELKSYTSINIPLRSGGVRQADGSADENQTLPQTEPVAQTDLRSDTTRSPRERKRKRHHRSHKRKRGRKRLRQHRYRPENNQR